MAAREPAFAEASKDTQSAEKNTLWNTTCPTDHGLRAAKRLCHKRLFASLRRADFGTPHAFTEAEYLRRLILDSGVTPGVTTHMEQESKGPETQRNYWKPVQVYVLAGICLLIGLPVGYLLRGSAPEPTPAAVQALTPTGTPPGMPASVPAAMPPSASTAGAAMPGGMPHPAPTLADMKRMADKKAEPLLTQLKSKPDDAKLLNQIGIVYRSAHQFDDARQYFQKSLAVDPKNADVRTDMAACMFYTGDVDGAISELDQALKYDPKHPGALMNLGIIKWKAKNDVPGALSAWEKLLKSNPNFPQKSQVERLIAEAQQSKS